MRLRGFATLRFASLLFKLSILYLSEILPRYKEPYIRKGSSLVRSLALLLLLGGRASFMFSELHGHEPRVFNVSTYIDERRR